MGYSRKEMQDIGSTPSQILERMQQVVVQYQTEIERAKAVWHTSSGGDAWTPAQITEHVLKANASFGRILQLFVKTAATQAPMPENTTPARLQENGKPKSPAILEPSSGQDWDTLQPQWQEAHDKLFAEMQNPCHASDTRTFQHPFLGGLTPVQWMQFAVLHTRDHLGQLQKLL